MCVALLTLSLQEDRDSQSWMTGLSKSGTRTGDLNGKRTGRGGSRGGNMKGGGYRAHSNNVRTGQEVK